MAEKKKMLIIKIEEDDAFEIECALDIQADVHRATWLSLSRVRDQLQNKRQKK